MFGKLFCSAILRHSLPFSSLIWKICYRSDLSWRGGCVARLPLWFWCLCNQLVLHWKPRVVGSQAVVCSLQAGSTTWWCETSVASVAHAPDTMMGVLYSTRTSHHTEVDSHVLTKIAKDSCLLQNEKKKQIEDHALPQRGFGLSTPEGAERSPCQSQSVLLIFKAWTYRHAPHEWSASSPSPTTCSLCQQHMSSVCRWIPVIWTFTMQLLRAGSHRNRYYQCFLHTESVGASSHLWVVNLVYM
jgi:hypothetical protein